MPESLIPIAEIAQHLVDLIRAVRSLQQRVRTQDKEFDLGSSEEPQDSAGLLPSTGSDYKHPVTEVTSIIDATTIRVRRQIPDAGGAGWTDDPELVTQLEVVIPSGPLPEVGQIVMPVYTGLFQINTLTNTISLPRYGLFGKGVNSARALLTSNRSDGDLLDCRLLNSSNTPVNSIVVARPPDLQRSFYDGQTINSITFTASTKDIRSATDGTTPEIHRITPDYVEDISILIVTRLEQGTGLVDNDEFVVWQDITTRAWAREQ